MFRKTECAEAVHTGAVLLASLIVVFWTIAVDASSGGAELASKDSPVCLAVVILQPVVDAGGTTVRTNAASGVPELGVVPDTPSAARCEITAIACAIPNHCSGASQSFDFCP